MLATYLGMLVLLAGATVLGQAALSLSGRKRWSWTAPAVGLAALEVVCAIAVRLPGRTTTAAVCAALLIGLAAAWLGRGRLRPALWRGPLVAVFALLFASLPFIANGRVGLLGVSLDNDNATHLILAAALRSPSLFSYLAPHGYPLGPHSLAVTLSTATGIRLDLAFTALLLVIAPITALAAASIIEGAALWRRIVVGLLASLGYLTAAYYAQGSFKETMMGLFVIAFALELRSLAGTQREPKGGLRRWALAGIPASLIAAAAVYTYSYLALAWIGGMLVVWLAGEVLTRPAVIRSRMREHDWRTAAVTLVLSGVGIAVILLAPYLHGLEVELQLFGTNPANHGILTSNVGNLAGPLSPYEALGIWLQANYRAAPPDLLQAGELSALALAALVFGIFWHLRRRELILLAAFATCAAIYWRAHATQSPYVSAKALVIATPIVMALIGRALLTRDATASRGARATKLLAGVLFAGVALHYSSLVLRAEPVAAPAQISELGELSSALHNQPTLFLGHDDFAEWELGGGRIGYLSASGPGPSLSTQRSAKASGDSDPLDFDSVAAPALDAYRYVITTNTPYASQAPANFRLARVLPQYELWERIGATAPRQSLERAAGPGAVLDCATAAGARLSRTPGSASVMPTPVVVRGPASIAPGQRGAVSLRLPAGRWALSLEYVSNENLQLSAAGSTWSLPAYLGWPGPYFYFGTVRSTGMAHRVVVSILETHPSLLTSSGDNAQALAIAATREPDTRTILPLSRSCGRYIDWYRTS